MKERMKALTPISMLFSSLLFLAGGVFLLAWPARALSLMLRVLAVALAVSGALTILAFLGRREKRLATKLAEGVALLAGAGAIWALPSLLQASVSLLWGIWILIVGVSKICYAGQLFAGRERGGAFALFQGVGSVVFAIAVLARPLSSSPAFALAMGLYCLAQFLFSFADFLRELFLWDVDGRHVRRRIRLSLPVLFTALIPFRLLDEVNQAIELPEQVIAPPGKANGEMEIFFHLSKSTAYGFGHVDVAFRGHVYSFAGYNVRTNRLMGVFSQGILAKIPRGRYIQYELREEKKKLIGFTLALDARQMEQAEREIAALLAQCEPWQPPEDAKGKGEPAALLRAATGAEFFRFRRGPFRTYSVLYTNCVALAARICGSSGLAILNPNGIITPGTYYAYVNRQFQRVHSVVTKRTLYK